MHVRYSLETDLLKRWKNAFFEKVANDDVVMSINIELCIWFYYVGLSSLNKSSRTSKFHFER
jgi:hypothetical protein